MFIDFVKQLPGNHIVAPKLKNLLVNLPSYALKPVNLVPSNFQQAAIQKVLSKVLAEALVDDELEFLEGNWLHINITDVPYEFYISVDESGKLLIEKKLEQEANVCFAGDTQSMLQLMSRNIDPDTLFFQRKLLVTGDTELGLEIKNFLDDMNLEHLPKLVHKGLQHYNQLVVENLS